MMQTFEMDVAEGLRQQLEMLEAASESTADVITPGRVVRSMVVSINDNKRTEVIRRLNGAGIASSTSLNVKLAGR